MKKGKILLSTSSVLSSLLIGIGVFADQIPTADPSSEKTSVTATLNAPTTMTPKAPTDPAKPDESGNKSETVTGVDGKLGIAYYPKSFNFTGNLGGETLILSDSSDSISPEATYNVGVKDDTRQANSWTLKAVLHWNSDEIQGATIKITNPDNGKVKQNINNGTTPFENNDLVQQSDVQGTTNNTVTLSETEQTIMTKNNNTVGKGTYDYSLGKLGSLQLTIPNATNLEAKNYSGNVNWNLAITP